MLHQVMKVIEDLDWYRKISFVYDLRVDEPTPSHGTIFYSTAT